MLATALVSGLGLGSIYGAMVGGLVLGIAEVLTVGFLASSYRDAFSFALLIAVLLFRPQGLFARRGAVGR